MELNDEITIPAKLELVYKSLNDLEVLKSCIPGCEELIEEDDGKLSAKVVLKIGPIKAKFKGKVTMDLSNGPTKYSLTGEGDGGVAGFVFGTFGSGGNGAGPTGGQATGESGSGGVVVVYEYIA